MPVRTQSGLLRLGTQPITGGAGDGLGPSGVWISGFSSTSRVGGWLRRVEVPGPTTATPTTPGGTAATGRQPAPTKPSPYTSQSATLPWPISDTAGQTNRHHPLAGSAAPGRNRQTGSAEQGPASLRHPVERARQEPAAPEVPTGTHQPPKPPRPSISTTQNTQPPAAEETSVEDDSHTTHGIPSAQSAGPG